MLADVRAELRLGHKVLVTGLAAPERASDELGWYVSRPSSLSHTSDGSRERGRQVAARVGLADARVH